MSALVNDLLTVSQYASNGSVSPVALGGALQILGSGGWIENKGPCALYLVAIGDTPAKADPISRGRTILPNGALEIPKGLALADYGLLADATGGLAFVLGS